MDLGFSFSAGITACTGAEVNILADGTFDVRMIQISLQKKLIHIATKKQYTAGLSAINKLKIKGPLAITFTGRGVLIKKTTGLEVITEQTLRGLFPNMKMGEFYIQHFLSGANSFVALVRKEVVDPLLEAFSKQGTAIMMLSLGPFVVEQVIPQLNNYNGLISFDGHQLLLNAQKQWLDYSYAPNKNSVFELKVDIEPIAEQFLIGYATAFQLMLHDRMELVNVEAEPINERLAEQVAKLKFQRNGAMVLIFFFTVLLINFLVFSYYHSDNQELAGKVGRRSDVFADRQKLESEMKEKELQVKQLGWNKGLNYAFICDQVGQTVPGTITLHELSLNAMRENTYSSAKKGQLATGSMRITGKSANVYVLNDWIYVLRKKSWLKSVLLEKYATDDQQQVQVFTLLLTY